MGRAIEIKPKKLSLALFKKTVYAIERLGTFLYHSIDPLFYLRALVYLGGAQPRKEDGSQGAAIC